MARSFCRLECKREPGLAAELPVHSEYLTLELADRVAGSIDHANLHALPSRHKYKAKIKISGSEMRLTVQLLLAMAVIPSLVQAARAEGAAGPIHIATYVEVGASSDKDGIKLLQQYRD